MNNKFGRGLSFARRMYVPRIVGLGICFFCVAAALYPITIPGWVWAVVIFYSYVWPHVAFQLASRSKNPYRAERRNLIYDSAFSGFWAGSMGLNVLPSVTVLSMMAMNNVASGGPRLFFTGGLAQLAGALLGYFLFLPALFPSTTEVQVLACVPMLVVYPLAIGLVCYRVAVKLSQHKKELQKLSTTDSLTGLMNHGAWKHRLEQEFRQSRVLNEQYSVALIDVDHFKSINDSFGHLVGDVVLKQLSNALTSTLRVTDVSGRYGGDEFCVILPSTTLTQAGEILERLRRTFSEHQHSHLPNLQLSLSIGIAANGEHQTDADEWLHEADMALYLAKTAGRNRVCLATTPQ